MNFLIYFALRNFILKNCVLSESICARRGYVYFFQLQEKAI